MKNRERLKIRLPYDQRYYTVIKLRRNKASAPLEGADYHKEQSRNTANSDTRTFRSFEVISAFQHDTFFFLIFAEKGQFRQNGQIFSALKLKASRIIEICINLKLNFIFSLYSSEKRKTEIQ